MRRMHAQAVTANGRQVNTTDSESGTARQSEVRRERLSVPNSLCGYIVTPTCTATPPSHTFHIGKAHSSVGPVATPHLLALGSCARPDAAGRWRRSLSRTRRLRIAGSPLPNSTRTAPALSQTMSSRRCCSVSERATASLRHARTVPCSAGWTRRSCCPTLELSSPPPVQRPSPFFPLLPPHSLRVCWSRLCQLWARTRVMRRCSK